MACSTTCSGIISPGSLIEIAVPDGESHHYFFLASVVKKPVVQVLLRGFRQVSEDGALNISWIEPGSATIVPCLCTGHQAFHQLCAEHHASKPLEKLDLWPLEYQLDSLRPLLRGMVTGRGQNQKLLTKMPRQAPSQCTFTMPFGLARPKRKRATAKSSMKRKAAKTKSDPRASSAWGPSEVLQELQVGDADVSLISSDSSDEKELAQLSDSDCSVSIPNSDSEPEVAEVDFGDGDEGCHPSGISLTLRTPAEEMFKPPSRKEEEKQVAKLQSDRAARIQSFSTPSNPTLRNKSYCNNTLGLVDAGVQKAAKLATCRHCLSKVERGAPRFAFAFHLQKFAAWVHKDCIYEHLIQEQASIDQAKDFVANLLQDGGKLEVCVREAAISLQRQLLSHSGESSSSGIERNV